MKERKNHTSFIVDAKCLVFGINLRGVQNIVRREQYALELAGRALSENHDGGVVFAHDSKFIYDNGARLKVHVIAKGIKRLDFVSAKIFYFVKRGGHFAVTKMRDVRIIANRCNRVHAANSFSR